MAFSRSDTAGWNTADMNVISEKILSDKTYEAFIDENLASTLADTAPLSILSGGGTVAKFKTYGRPTVSAYTANSDISYARQTGSEFELTLDKAFYGANRLDDMDKQAIMNVDTEGLGRMGRMLNEEHGDNECAEMAAYLIAYVASQPRMANNRALTGMFYKGGSGAQGAFQAADVLIASNKMEPSAGNRYVLDPFKKAALARKRMNIKSQQYAIVAPELISIIESAEEFKQSIGGVGYEDAIRKDEWGNIHIKGFKLIPWNKLVPSTYYTITNAAPIIFGSKEAFSFFRVVNKTETGRFEKQFGEWLRQLVAFGMGVHDSRLFGVDYLKIA